MAVNAVWIFFEADTEKIFLEILLYILHSAIQYLLALIDQYNLITDLFYLFHAVCTEDDGSAVLCKTVDLILN